VDRLVLWDVDGTLLRGGAAAREALTGALGWVLGREVGSDHVQMSGKTDPGILAELAMAAGVDDADVPEVVQAAVAVLPDRFADVAERFAREGRVLPGVPEILTRLHDRGDVLQTLLTGNLRPTGIGKVAAFGLDRWLEPDLGAYGSDDEVRERLVPIAVERAAQHARRSWDGHEVWVVGDTPRDLSCARAGGVRCLLVATGRFAFDELDGLGADAVLPDLADTDAVEALLIGGVDGARRNLATPGSTPP
jgi:phosphoglycolate phosphatase